MGLSAMRRLARSLAVLVATTSAPASAFPFPREVLHDLIDSALLAARQGGVYPLFTTTWTETQTHTSTAFGTSAVTPWPLATGPIPATVTCTTEPGLGQTFCGNICCASWQGCAGYPGNVGTCTSKSGAQQTGDVSGGGGAVIGTTITTIYTSAGNVITTAFSAALRPTGSGSGTVVATQTGILAGATTTGNGTVVATSSGGGLSPGAIAGIVIGVLAAIVILLLLCVCCVVRGLWHGLLSLLGLRKKKEKRHSRETIIEEEEYRRTGSVHSRRDKHGSWYEGGARPGGVASRRTTESSGGGNGFLGLGAAGATLLVLLGLRRDKKRRQNEKVQSHVSSTHYSDYTESSPSE
jgi:hypothetical protein